MKEVPKMKEETDEEVIELSEQRIEGIMRDFVKALEQKDVEKALSFLTEDADYVTPEGTFKGKEALRRYLTWMTRSSQDQRILDAGISIMVKEGKAVYEHNVVATYKGTKYEVPTVCVYEFKGDKIQHLRTVSDRLTIAKQVAKGRLEKTIVNSILSRMEKGLH